MYICVLGKVPHALEQWDCRASSCLRKCIQLLDVQLLIYLNYGTKFSVRGSGLERPTLDLTARPAFCTPTRIGAAEAHIADRASCKSSPAPHHVDKTTERITYY
jgi:hypothetical protein